MKVLRWLVLLSLAGMAACQRAPKDPVARGELYFKGLGCAKCHAIGSAGAGWGPDLTFVGFRQSPQWLDLWLKDPHAWHKQTVMPAFHLSDGARQDLVAFLSAQRGQAFDNAAGRPWNTAEAKASGSVKRGELLFTKAGCVACHAPGGLGGHPNNNVVAGQIPALLKVAEGYTKTELKAKIRNGAIPSPADPSKSAPMVVMPKWGDALQDDELDAVADYLLSLGKAPGGAKKDAW